MVYIFEVHFSPWDWFSEQLNCSHQGLVSFRVAWKTACYDYVQISMHIWLNLYQRKTYRKIEENISDT